MNTVTLTENQRSWLKHLEVGPRFGTKRTPNEVKLLIFM